MPILPCELNAEIILNKFYKYILKLLNVLNISLNECIFCKNDAIRNWCLMYA